MKDRENELFNYLNQLGKDETSDTPLLFKANIKNFFVIKFK